MLRVRSRIFIFEDIQQTERMQNAWLDVHSLLILTPGLEGNYFANQSFRNSPKMCMKGEYILINYKLHNKGERFH